MPESGVPVFEANLKLDQEYTMWARRHMAREMYL